MTRDLIKKRVILAVTGIRSDYDILSSVYRAIDHDDRLELKVAATGAHLSHAFGYTLADIKSDGFIVVDEIESLLSGDYNSSRVKGLAIQLQGLVQTVTRVKPDILLVLGDREESISTALVGAYMNIPVAHIGGGDRVVGNVDDQVRHAVTKLAHIHLVTNDESEERIIRLGEQEFRVFNVGNPGLDRILDEPYLNHSMLSENIGFSIKKDEPFVIVIQHLLSTESREGYNQMKCTLEALEEIGVKVVLSYPNSDAGSSELLRAIREYEDLPFLHSAKNIPRIDFINLLRLTSCLVGNSSAGILEAPILKIPVVNIGNRQHGRLHAENVEFIPHDKNLIMKYVRRAIFDENYKNSLLTCSNPYGDGKSSKRIADILATITIDKELIIKDITY